MGPDGATKGTTGADRGHTNKAGANEKIHDFVCPNS